MSGSALEPGNTTAGSDDANRVPVPDSLPAGSKMALQHCTLYEIKGSCFRLLCDICGWTGTTSAHKLTYGHYLRQKGNDIDTCVAPAKLEADYPEFWAQLNAKLDNLNEKRR